MATRAQIAAARRNIKKAQAAWRSMHRHHSSETRSERSRASRLGWAHRRAQHLRFR